MSAEGIPPESRFESSPEGWETVDLQYVMDNPEKIAVGSLAVGKYTQFALEKVIAGLHCIGGMNVSTKDYDDGYFTIAGKSGDALRQFFDDPQMQQLMSHYPSPESEVGPNAIYYSDEQGRKRIRVYQVLPGKRDGYGVWIPSEELVDHWH